MTLFGESWFFFFSFPCFLFSYRVDVQLTIRCCEVKVEEPSGPGLRMDVGF